MAVEWPLAPVPEHRPVSPQLSIVRPRHPDLPSAPPFAHPWTAPFSRNLAVVTIQSLCAMTDADTCQSQYSLPVEHVGRFERSGALTLMPQKRGMHVFTLTSSAIVLTDLQLQLQHQPKRPMSLRHCPGFASLETRHPYRRTRARHDIKSRFG
jgi:hypothetical protein